jgi:RNA polymerase sigma factor (sigma-70 family)
MIKNNPFSSKYQHVEDVELIRLSLSGDKESLTALLERHQPFIYNIALKMINNVADAEDTTQEIFIKIITNLAKYDAEKSKFTTWLYRIVVNHILDLKKQKYEILVEGFDDFFTAIEGSKVIELTEIEEQEMALQIEESKVACMSGMLMCLDREQRMIYILGALFEIDHNLGAEIFNVSTDNFRQKLSRAKKDLHQWMHNRCGLVNTENPCRCPKKTKGFIEKGWVEQENMKWNSNFTQQIKDFSEENIHSTLITVDDLYSRLYKEHPFKITKIANQIVKQIIGNPKIKAIFDN